MRELERDCPSVTRALVGAPDLGRRLAVVGAGRVGNALVRALGETQFEVVGPLGRGADGHDADAVLLCVPDAEIASAAAVICPGRLVGHCSGASGLNVLAPHEGFSMHPLMSVTHGVPNFAGAGAATDGDTPRAQRYAEELARALGMRPVHVAAEDRPLYHAAASIASNFLVTLEAAAERLALLAGVDRELLVPLVRATIENWADLGGSRALTGPVARGDQATVERQREAIDARAPDLVGLFDTLVEATRALVLEPKPA